MTVPLQFADEPPGFDLRPDHQNVAQVVPLPPQITERFTTGYVAEIEKRNAQEPEKNDTQTGKDNVVKEKYDSEKNKHGKRGALNDVRRLTEMARNSPRPIQVEEQKHR